ncbi:MAG: ATP-binding cassette domain-containing protein, partial [Janthinobacterium lividum]
AFLGYDPRSVRYRVTLIAAAFAGLGGSLAALVFEIATPDALSTLRSGDIVMMTVLGGTAHWTGPLLGAAVASLVADVLPGYTRAWAFYLAVAFVAVVLALARRARGSAAVSPGSIPGIAGIVADQAKTVLALRRVSAATRPAATLRLCRAYGQVLLSLGMVAAAGITLVEHVYRARLADDEVAQRAWPDSMAAVIVALAVLGVGVLWQRNARTRLRSEAAAVRGVAELTRARLLSEAAASPSAVAPLPPAAASSLQIAIADEDAKAPAASRQVAHHGAVAAALGANVRARIEPKPPQALALTVHRLRMHFGRTQVLAGVDLQVRAGEKLALIGPNGAGKTTLFDLLSHRLKPTGGDIHLDMHRLAGETPQELARLGVARTFQVSGLFQGMTVFEHLRCAVAGSLPTRYAWHRPIHAYLEIEARAWRALEAVGLPPDSLAGELAYADQRALELAMAVAQEARLLLLDEPTAGMNGAEAARSLALIERISRGRTVLMIEHDMDIVFNFADRVAVLVDGVIIACDVPARVRDDARVRDAYLGALNLDGVDG